MGAGLELWGYRKDRTQFPIEISLNPVEIAGEALVWAALNKLKVVKGTIPMCPWCKRVRHEGSWQPPERYIEAHLQSKFTLGLCEDCLQKLDPALGAGE